jgi:hypothetical protein
MNDVFAPLKLAKSLQSSSFRPPQEVDKMKMVTVQTFFVQSSVWTVDGDGGACMTLALTTDGNSLAGGTSRSPGSATAIPLPFGASVESSYLSLSTSGPHGPSVKCSNQPLGRYISVERLQPNPYSDFADSEFYADPFEKCISRSSTNSSQVFFSFLPSAGLRP